MSIAITVEWNNDFKEIAAITLPIMQEYCIRHGYTFISKWSPFGSPEIVWERVRSVRDALITHAVVVHMDADVLITNLRKPIPKHDADVLMCKDGNGLNDGVCVWNEKSNSAFTLDSLRSRYLQMLFTSPQEALNAQQFPSLKIISPDKNILNSYPEDWLEGDFVLHLPGRGNEERVRILKQHLDKIIR